MGKRKNKKIKVPYYSEAVTIGPLEVKLEECDGDSTKMIKKFTKKVRKEEILRPLFGKFMYFSTKSQLKRHKRLKSIYEQSKNLKNLEE